MKDDNKTKQQLVHELTELRSQNAALEKSITGSKSADLVVQEAIRYAESIVETVRGPLLVLDADLKIISANRNFYTTFKVVLGETIGSFIYDLGNKQWDIPKLRELLQDILPKKEAFDDFEVAHNFQDIGHKIMLLNARQMYRKDIDSKIILLAIEDITERKEIEAGLEKTRKELAVIKIAADEVSEYAESVINTVREPLIALDQDLRVVTASRSFYEVFKVKPEETVGQRIYNLGNNQWDIPKLRELLEDILPQKATFDNYEVEHDFATIGRRVMLLNARQIKRVLGKERIILLAIEDITERKRLEDILTESEELYRGVYRTASDGILLLEKREGKINHLNPAAKKILGYSEEESIGNKLQDVGFMFDMGDFQTIMQNLHKDGIINYTDVPVKTKSGQQIYADIYLVNKTTAIQCNVRDVTERKRIETALRTSEERFRRVFQTSPAPIYISTISDGRYIDVNDSGLQLLGYTREEMIGHTVQELGIWHNFPERKPILQNLIAQGSIRNESVLLRTKNGEVKETLLSCETIRLDDEEVMLSLVHDITERKQANLKLEKQNKELVFQNEEKKKRAAELVIANKELVFQNEEKEKRAAELVIANKELSFQNEEKEKRAAELVIANKELEQGITARKQTEVELQQTLENLRKAVGATIQVMVSAVEMRDPYTAGHQTRVADLASAITTEMGLPQDKIDGIHMAGSIHDIGKLSIPAEILSKPTKLTNIEFSLIKEHSQKGYDMLKDVESPWPLAEIVYQHHERMDGSGYPRNLKGNEILIEARIMAVADVVESMASHRPYRPALGIDVALEEIETNRGTLYDNTVADACLRLFREKGFQLEGTRL